MNSLRPAQCVTLTLTLFCLPIVFACDGGDSADASLEDRLVHAFSRYDSAREQILQRVAVEDGRVERAEWEGWLAAEPGLALDLSDLQQLAALHQTAIEAARDAAVSASAIDLDAFRSDRAEVERFCRQLPKGGMLHIHPGGTRNRQTVLDLLDELDPLVDGPAILESANDGQRTMLYADEVAFLSDLPVERYSTFDQTQQSQIADLLFLPVDPPTHDFMRFEALFSIGDALYGQDPAKQDWFSRKTYTDFLQRAAALGVRYVEFTRVSFDPASSFAHWSELGPELEQETGVQVRWNVAFIRTLSDEINAPLVSAQIDAATQAPSPYGVGIDLLANETDTPALETGQAIYVPVLQAALDGTIETRRTMHAGELGRVENVRDALIMGTERIGHGYLLQDDLLTLEFARRRQVPIEANIVSNYRLQVCSDYADHPFLPYLRLGLPVSLSTDDEGMFHTDIANECRVAVMNTDVQYAELVQLARNAIDTAFADDETKAALRQQLEQDLADFEVAWP